MFVKKLNNDLSLALAEGRAADELRRHDEIFFCLEHLEERTPPAHLILADVSRKLRDHLCPLDSLATLQDDVSERKTLDELLQTNIGITQNLKTGLITLAPLATSLLAGLLKTSINPFGSP